MLEVLGNFASCTINGVLGFYVIKKISKSEVKLLCLHTILWLLLEVVISTYLQQTQYLGIHTLIIYCVNILIYKNIFNLNLNSSIIANVLAIGLIFIGDIFVYIVMSMILNVNRLIASWKLFLITNILIAVFTIGIVSIKVIQTKLQNFYNTIKDKAVISNTIFFVLVLFIITIIVYNLCINIKITSDRIVYLLVGAILTILMYIFIDSKNNYSKLSNEYDALFSYVQNFEDWIEKDQLNRHEYKNQLAVLRCLTKEKKVKDKIDEILEDSINIEGQAVTNLKNLPKGGIKGLMYYKAAIAQKHKVNLTTDVSLERKGLLTKLSEKDIRVLCKLIGIYFDNAIEAAAESRKKNLTIEVYELKDKVTFVFSNTFKRHRNMKDRNKKGVSSKGEGRGNGLYFASKLIKDNSRWITEKQEIIDKYYIQQLIVYNKVKEE